MGMFVQNLQRKFESNDTEINITDNLLIRSKLRKSLLGWKDKHLTEIECHLRKKLPELSGVIKDKLNTLTVIESTISIRASHKKTIQPIIDEWVKNQVFDLMTNAQNDLHKFYQTKLGQVNHQSHVDDEHNLDYLLDVGLATSVGISGLAAIPIVSAFSTVSTAGFLGLFTITTISLPILAIGTLTVGALFALGGHKFSKVKEKSLNRFHLVLLKSITDQILDGVDKNKTTLCDQLKNNITTTYVNIINEKKL